MMDTFHVHVYVIMNSLMKYEDDFAVNHFLRTLISYDQLNTRIILLCFPPSIKT